MSYEECDREKARDDKCRGGKVQDEERDRGVVQK